MSEVINVEFHSKWLTDFELIRLVRATNQKYTIAITAFFGHLDKDDFGRHADCSIIQTGKILSARKEGRFWLLATHEGHYVVGTFKRGGGRASLLQFLKSGERL